MTVNLIAPVVPNTGGAFNFNLQCSTAGNPYSRCALNSKVKEKKKFSGGKKNAWKLVD